MENKPKLSWLNTESLKKKKTNEQQEKQQKEEEEENLKELEKKLKN